MKLKEAILQISKHRTHRDARESRRLIYSMSVAILTFSILALSSRQTFAQSSATLSRSVSIGVAVGLSVYTDNNLNFGTVVVGTGVNSVAVTDAAAGKVTVSGQWNKTIIVTLTPPANLASGSNTLPYTPGAAYNGTADDPTTATVWSPPSGTQAGFRLRANRSGQTAQAFIYLFGSVNVGSIPPGDYSGIYTISVSY